MTLSRLDWIAGIDFQKRKIRPSKKFQEINEGTMFEKSNNILEEYLLGAATKEVLTKEEIDMAEINMAENPHIASKRFIQLADNLFSLKFVTSCFVDSAKFQFEEMLQNEVTKIRRCFLKSVSNNSLLMNFFIHCVGTNAEYRNLWMILN